MQIKSILYAAVVGSDVVWEVSQLPGALAFAPQALILQLFASHGSGA